MKRHALIVVVSLATACAALAQEAAPGKDAARAPVPPAPSAPVAPSVPATPPEAPKPPPSPMVLSGVVKDIDGKDVDLASFKDKVCLIVNVASNCGYTHQYVGLEALYQKKKDQGFVILAFPANDFLGQEPGTAEQIKEVCYGKYKVTFPVFSKVSVVAGPEQSPLYKQIAAQPAPVGGDPKWNFTKFLVDRSGNVLERFEPRIQPTDAALLTAIDRELGKKGTDPAKPAPAAPAPAAEGGK